MADSNELPSTLKAAKPGHYLDHKDRLWTKRKDGLWHPTGRPANLCTSGQLEAEVVVLMDVVKLGADLERELRNARFEGIIEGITRFAHWKDDVQYVGTCGLTLDAAIDGVREEFGKK